MANQHGGATARGGDDRGPGVRVLRATLLAAMAGIVVACGGGGGGDDASWLYPLWVETDVVVADVDGDGRADVLTLAQLSTSMSERTGRLVVRRQTAPGVFAPGESITVGTYPWKMVVADVDGDGAPDLVVGDVGAAPLGFPNAVWLLRQDAVRRGQFQAPQRLAGSFATDPYDLAIGDVNADSLPDIVVAASLAGTPGATLLAQDIANPGTFLAPAPIGLAGHARTVAIGDLDADGLDDLAFRIFLSSTNYVPSTTLGLVRQLPGGLLAPVAALAPLTGLNGSRLTIADADGSGTADLVEFLTSSSDDYTAKFSTLLQASPPTGSFSIVDTALADVRGVDGVAQADLDGDALPDLASVGAFPVGSPSTIESWLRIFMRNGSGGLTAAPILTMPIPSSRVAAGDVNADGRTDLVVLGSENRVFVLLQSGAVPGTYLAPWFLN